MRNKRLIIALTGAVIFGLIATMAVMRYVTNAQSFTKSLGNIVVAKVAIQLGAKITAEDLVLVAMPNGSMPEGAFNSLENVIGRVAVTNIGVREPVTSFKLAPAGAAGGLSAVIPEGFRAMTVKVDDVVGISGFVMPGSFVDIVAVIAPAGEQNAAQGPISKIVLQNIKVLANGGNLDEAKDGREPTRVQAVTLQVTPEQAEKLALASNEGSLQLVMRNYGDQDDTETRGASKRSLLTGDAVVLAPAPKNSDQVSPTTPPVSRPRVRVAPPVVPRETAPPVSQSTQPAAPPRRTVEVIEGAKKRSVDFP